VPTELLEETQSRAQLARPWQVILFNDDWHAFDQVVLYVQKATGCSEPLAHAITLAAHQTGQSSCYAGALEACERVAAKLEEIRLRVSVERVP
jgi:ATP-dependent Clp protease adaptor protein ClpS